jgi:hypothetical protein
MQINNHPLSKFKNQPMIVILLSLVVLSVVAITAESKEEKTVAVITNANPIDRDRVITVGEKADNTERNNAASRGNRSSAVTYKSNQLSDAELIQVLESAGFSGNSLKQAWAIVMRESGGNSNAFNGNSNTGDKSYGLFQINMIGKLGPDRLAKYGLESNDSLFNPQTNARVAYQMSSGGTNWGAWDVGPDAYLNGKNEPKYYYWLAKYPN